MKYLLVLASFFSTMALAVENQVTVCKHGDKERKIEIVYSEGTTTPCEVQYTKDLGAEVLWSAANTEGYCEEKAADFIAKQEGWGWTCTTEMPAAEAPVVEEETTTEEAPAETTETQEETQQ